MSRNYYLNLNILLKILLKYQLKVKVVFIYLLSTVLIMFYGVKFKVFCDSGCDVNSILSYILRFFQHTGNYGFISLVFLLFFFYRKKDTVKSMWTQTINSSKTRVRFECFLNKLVPVILMLFYFLFFYCFCFCLTVWILSFFEPVEPWTTLGQGFLIILAWFYGFICWNRACRNFVAILWPDPNEVNLCIDPRMQYSKFRFINIRGNVKRRSKRKQMP